MSIPILLILFFFATVVQSVRRDEVFYAKRWKDNPALWSNSLQTEPINKTEARRWINFTEGVSFLATTTTTTTTKAPHPIETNLLTTERDKRCKYYS